MDAISTQKNSFSNNTSKESVTLFDWAIAPLIVGGITYVVVFSLGEIAGIIAFLTVFSNGYQVVTAEFNRVGSLFSCLAFFVHIGFVASRTKYKLAIIPIIACAALAALRLLVPLLYK